MSCEDCRHRASDSCMDVYWHVCDHPSFWDVYEEGRAIGPDLEKTPTWCPKEED